MPLYNFTVRARDNAGAFSDRDFSINVRNTITDRHIVSAANGGASYSSVDGVNWTMRPGAMGRFAAYGAGKWVSYGTNKDGAQTYYSSNDAINWIAHTRPSVYIQSSIQEPPMAYGNGKWMTFGTGTIYNDRCFVSDDAATWVSAGSVPKGTAPHATVGGRLAFGNGRWIATYNITDSTCFGWSSADNGTSWEQITLSVKCRITDIIYVNGMWIASDAVNFCIWTSIDGTNWAKRTLPAAGASRYPWRIAYGNGVLVATVYSSYGDDTGWYSHDAVNWTKIDSTAGFFVGTNHLSGVSFAGGTFVVASPLGIKYSRNGIDWTSVSGITGNFSGAAGLTVG